MTERIISDILAGVFLAAVLIAIYALTRKRKEEKKDDMPGGIQDW